MDNIGVLVAMVTMVILAFTIVLIKVRVNELLNQNLQKYLQISMFPTDKVVTFTPLTQQVGSTIRYTGNGFIPCRGFVCLYNCPDVLTIPMADMYQHLAGATSQNIRLHCRGNTKEGPPENWGCPGVQLITDFGK